MPAGLMLVYIIIFFTLDYMNFGTAELGGCYCSKKNGNGAPFITAGKGGVGLFIASKGGGGVPLLLGKVGVVFFFLFFCKETWG